MVDGALQGIRVIELGQGVSAPFCAKLFADYGAEVVKVEPLAGDVARRWGPFPADQPHPEKGGLFFFLNTNKRGVTVDVGTRDGRNQLLRLLEQADVFIENNRPQQMRQWGLDYSAIAAINPDLVMISITPFGQTGPYADWKGYDLNAFHLSAAGSRYCGRPNEPPLQHGTFSAEFFGAYVAAAWGLAAVCGRARTGGQHLDVSCAEAVAALFVGAQNIGGYAQDGKFETRTGVGMPLGAPATILPCKDGYVWMMALEPGQWNGLRAAMGNPEWAELDMFQDMFVRAQNADMIYPLIEQWTREHGKQEIMDLCQANGCPTTALFTVAEVAEHPHLKERQYFVEVEHPVMGSVRTMGAPIRLPESPGGPRMAAPLLGEHNGEAWRSRFPLPSASVDKCEDVLREPQHERFQSPSNKGFSAHPELVEGHLRRKSTVPSEEGGRPTPPLAGVRVANFGWGWLGPVVGQTLGFLGAEVYKIESRARIDINRTLPPFAGGVRDPDRSLQNHAGWAGNGSVTIDLKKPEGQELARQFAAHCDVVLENFGPGVMAKLHLGYEELRALKPDLIMASMPAAGLFGPLKDIRTYGMSLSSITGLDSITGYLGGPPIPVENAFADPLGGVIGALGVLLGLHYRERTGKGQHIDFSQQEGVMQLIAPAFMDYVMNGRVAGPIGNRHPLGVAAPHGVFRCAGGGEADDRWISLAVFTEDEWQGLVEAMGNPTWAQVPEFADAARRVANIDVLHKRLSEWTRNFDDRTLAQRLQAHGVAAAPVLNVADLLDDPHYKARGTFIEVRHPLGFTETIYGAYVKTSGFKADVQPGPSIGQDNDYVFKQLMKITGERYRWLLDHKVIF